ncbi:MAG: DUF5666 domain-containing protein [Armatimonadetes bacterium]|nr:DUF5666 domain-containing protein [Armatimonadota bacterium]
MAISKRLYSILIVGMVLMSVAYIASADGEPCPITADVGSNWLATGTITQVNGPNFTMLGKDNKEYDVKGENSQFVANDADGSKYPPKVGDVVRVFGKVGEGCRIVASRVRLFTSEPAATASGPQKQIRIIIEKQPTEPAKTVELPPKIEQCPPDWQGSGLVMDIDYTGRKLKVRTSNGAFTVNIANATLTNGGQSIRLVSVNSGDAVRVSGNIVGVKEIDAQNVSIMRSRDDMLGALPQTPISILGTILSVDQVSMTFTMRTETAVLSVLADKDTILQNQMKCATFAELKPGVRVKMSGYGNLANGFVAHHIQIISIAR